MVPMSEQPSGDDDQAEGEDGDQAAVGTTVPPERTSAAPAEPSETVVR